MIAKRCIVYLDNQSTTPCDPRVLTAMQPWLAGGMADRSAAEAIELARAQVACSIGGDAQGIRFTSGATEANNLAIKGVAHRAGQRNERRRRIVTCATEHKCVLESAMSLKRDGFDPVILPVRPDGHLAPETLCKALAEPTLLVSVMTANNETGLIQNIPLLAGLAHAAGALFHTDAAQAVGKIPLHAERDGIDLLSVSGHKIYGPKGIGALWVRAGIEYDPLFSGPAACSPALIVGLGVACRIAQSEMMPETQRLAGLRDHLLTGLQRQIPGLRINGPMAARLPGNLNVQMPHPAAAILTACPFLCVSAGSACMAAALAPSYVLQAMGLDAAAAQCSLRLGLGRFTSAADVDYAINVLTQACTSNLAA